MRRFTAESPVECGFEYTEGIRVLILAMVVIPLLIVIFLFCTHVDFSTENGVVSYTACFAVMIAAAVIKLLLGKGRITADEEFVSVSYGFLSKKIPLSEIRSVRCEVETQGTRYGNVIYTMFLEIKTGESDYRYEQTLHVEKGYPARFPEEYRQYLESQPMWIVSDYISKRV